MFCVNEVLPRFSWLMKDSFSSSNRLSSPRFKQSQNSYSGAEGLQSALARTPPEPVAFSCMETSSSPSCIPTQASWSPQAEVQAPKGKVCQLGNPSF